METDNKTLEEQSCIARKSSFFGLFHHLVYMPTGSRITSYSRYYPPELREELKSLFALEDDKFAQRLSELPPYGEAVNGNALVTGHISADRQFVSLRLYIYGQIDYRPASKTYFLQGGAALQAAGVFRL
ncbi:MAG: hypothetical protein II970_00600 [Paludibacteraceae bacterium]|nr:hypothetical protein [Paludibacteraceae bacterium]